MKTRGLIVVDLQNEYLPTGKLPLAGIEAAVDNAAKVIADARSKGIPVFHIRHDMKVGNQCHVLRSRWKSPAAFRQAVGFPSMARSYRNRRSAVGTV